MTRLVINDKNVNDFNNCNPLEITYLKIYAFNNIELILNNLYKFKNLQVLCLDRNNKK